MTIKGSQHRAEPGHPGQNHHQYRRPAGVHRHRRLDELHLVTTPAELLRAYNALDGSRKTRALKIVEEPPEEPHVEQAGVGRLSPPRRTAWPPR